MATVFFATDKSVRPICRNFVNVEPECIQCKLEMRRISVGTPVLIHYLL